MKRRKISWALCVVAALSVTGLMRADDAKPQAGSNPEQLFKDLDKNADGQLTGDEINDDQKRFFERLVRVGDKNADGKLSLEEFKDATKPDTRPVEAPRGDAGGPGRQNIDEMFSRLDRNGDGKISKDEVPEQAKPRLDPLFERLGKDALTKDDLQQGRGRPGGFLGGSTPEETMKRLDKNGDGKISKDEVPDRAKQFLMPLFERLGKDEITKEDLQKFRERMQAQYGQGRPGQGRNEAGRNEAGRNEAGRNEAGRNEPGRNEPGRTESGMRRPGEGREAAERGREAGRGPAEGRDRASASPDGERQGPDGRRPVFPRLFEKLDTNHDGKISADELAKAGELFKELDENQDGQLDPRELLGPPPARRDGPGREGGGRDGGEGRGEPRDAGRASRNPEGRPDAEDRPAERKPEGDAKPRD